VARHNPIKVPGTKWFQFKEPLVPIWRFLTSQTQTASEETSSRFSKLWRYVDSPLTGIAIGLLAGAVVQSVSLASVFIVVWVLLTVQVFRVRPFGGTSRFVQMLGMLAISAVLATILWGGWRKVPKPQPEAKPATAAEIAAEVSKILPSGGVAPATTSATRTTRSTTPDVSLIFTDSPLFTPDHKRLTISAINSFYLYLKNLGFPVEKEVPPIGVSPHDVQMMGGTLPGSIYERHIYLPKNSLDDVDAIRRVYASYVFRTLFGTFGGASIGPDFMKDETTATLFEVYYTSSLANRNLDSTEWLGHRWMEALWDIRQKKGQDFTDRAMYYTYKTWDPKPVPGDFESKFWTRFLAGVWVIDNNGKSIEAVQSIVSQHHIPQAQ
jgi:hypothetical protein